MRGARHVAVNLLGCLWWGPTILLMVARLLWRSIYFRVSLYQARALRRAGRPEAGMRVLDDMERQVREMRQKARW